MVPIWVSEPIGAARPLRMARQPAMNVVPTAPMPGSRMPSLPEAGAMSVVGSDTEVSVERGWKRFRRRPTGSGAGPPEQARRSPAAEPGPLGQLPGFSQGGLAVLPGHRSPAGAGLLGE